MLTTNLNPMFGGYWPYGTVTQDQITAPEEVPATEQPATKRNFYSIDPLNSMGYFPDRCDPCGFRPVPPLTTAMMWQMRADPVIALVSNNLIYAPVLSSEYTIEIVNNRDQQEKADEIRNFLAQNLLPVFLRAMQGSVESILFGHWGTEIRWGIREGKMVPIEALPILPNEAVYHEDQSRKFYKYKIGDQERDAAYCFLAVNQPHIDPVKGYSRLHAAVRDWWRYQESSKNADAIERKASGRQLMLGIPQGQSFYEVDENGNKSSIDAQAFGRQLAANANTGNPFLVPLTIFSKDAIQQNAELAKVPAVTVEQLDWGDNGASLIANLQRLSALQTNMSRALFHGERESMEGQNGTKAEAETHRAGGVLDCELIRAQLTMQWDDQMTRRVIQQGYGEEWVGCIKTVPKPLSDPKKLVLQEAAKILISKADGNTMDNLNERAILEGAGYPVLSQEEADKAAIEREARAQQDAQLKAKAAMENPSRNLAQSASSKRLQRSANLRTVK